MAQDTDPFARVKTRVAYRAEREHIFPSDSSLDWFIRTNRGKLNEAHALLMLNGRIMIDHDAFDAALMKIAQAAATATA